MPDVTLIQGDRRDLLSAHPGETLLDLFGRCGVSFYAPCGGGHTCGKCRVKAAGALSSISAQEAALLGSAREADVRLACFARVEGTVTVTLQAPTEAKTGECHAVSSTPADETEPLGFAADIGTTTVALSLFGLKSRRLLLTESALNPQRTFGADVIARIDAAGKGALSALQSAIVSTLNGMLSSACRKAGAAVERVQKGVIAANTTMLHLLRGLDPASIAQAPFTPKSLFGADVPAGVLGLSMDPNAPVHLIRCLSAYVGGDITAGILAAGLGKPGENALLIDIGTNGEMALSRGRDIFCCSVAAGPALEGARIRYGMGGVPGAINQVTLTKEGLSVTTIGGEPAAGICGSGLLDAAAVLLDCGAVDETGRMDDELPPALAGRFLELDHQPAFLLSKEPGVAITQQDIRELQLAKAAFAAGIELLLKEAGLGEAQVDRVVLAGSFGCALNPQSACRIGLLPAAFLPKTQAGGNTAGLGAAAVLLEDGARARLTQIAWDAKYLELSGRADFNDAYVDAMLFPDGEE